MKILFVARHDPQDNQDENAITHAFRELGHEVTCIHEKFRHRPINTNLVALSRQHDVCLFLKHPDVREIHSLECPRVFWHFDMIQSVDDDITLRERSRTRVEWVMQVFPHCILTVFTDGDFVNKMNRLYPSPEGKPPRFLHLMQGADERVAGISLPRSESGAPILFTGMINHGSRRRGHIDHLRCTYGEQFEILGDGGPKYRLHGRALAAKFSECQVVVAPDGPSTQLYWSNRVYLTTSLGGLLLHPYCQGLRDQYPEEVLYMYNSRFDLDNYIQKILQWKPPRRLELIEAGYAYTMQYHTYRHRVEELVKQIQERI